MSRDEKNTFDIIIVGRGSLALATAYEIMRQEPSTKLSIVGNPSSPGGASMASGAMLGVFGEVTEDISSSSYGAKKLEMAYMAKKLWPKWLDEINDKLGYEEKIKPSQGTYIILNSESSKRDDRNFNYIKQTLDRFNEPYEEVNPASIDYLNAVESSRAIKSIFIPDENSINAQKLLEGLDIVLSSYENCLKIDRNVVDISKYKHNFFQIILENGESVVAKKIIIAAGAFSHALIAKIPEIRVPYILSGAGIGFTVECEKENQPSSVIRTPNRAGSCGMHLVPRDDNTMYIGASNSLELSPQFFPNLRDIYNLSQRAMEQLNQDFYQYRVKSWYIGNRPVAIDIFPLIGETSLEGLYILTGTYRDGLHLSPLLAKQITNKIFDKPALFDNPFLPERSPIETMTQKQSIDIFAEQYMSAGYESAIKLPYLGWNKLLDEKFHEQAEKIYSLLETNVAVPTDVLIMLVLHPEKIPVLRKYYDSLKKPHFAFAETCTIERVDP